MRMLGITFLLTGVISVANPSRATDLLQVQQLTKGVYAIVGELGNRSPENLANNATFGFVVTDEGVVLIDSGGTFAGAAVIDGAIKTVTDKAVVKVINSGGQDHRWLGNSYFQKAGAEIIASKNAVEDQSARVDAQMSRLSSLLGEEALEGTDAVYADIQFDREHSFELGGTRFEIYHEGQAHTPGDSFVWLPQSKTMFTGDIVYVERMLGVGPQSNSKSWLKVYQSMAAYGPEYLVPGHGSVTDIEHANGDTLDYLVFLRQSVSEFIDDGGEMTDISAVEQSRFSHLLNYNSIAGRNAQQVYSEMEWE